MTLKEKQELFELIKAQDYELKENQYPEEILEIALSELGNINPYIRDDLALEVGANLIYNDLFTEEKLKALCKRLLSEEFLFHGLDERKQDSVFIRTFTSLLLTMLFRIPNKKDIFSKEELEVIYDKYLVYLKKEYDYRGYVEDKGWAHFFAHSSDFLKYLFQQTTFNDEWVQRYLNAILDIIQNNHYVFHHNEDERFKNAFMKLFERSDINQNILINFLKNMISYKRVNRLPQDLNTYVNVKNILRTIFFALDDSNLHVKNIVLELIDNFKVKG